MIFTFWKLIITCNSIFGYSTLDKKIEYSGSVYLYSSGMPLELVDIAKSKLIKDHGILSNDIVLIEMPEGVPEGSIMVTIWPHYLSVAKVKRVRDGSIYAPQLFNIELWI